MVLYIYFFYSSTIRAAQTYSSRCCLWRRRWSLSLSVTSVQKVLWHYQLSEFSKKSSLCLAGQYVYLVLLLTFNDTHLWGLIHAGCGVYILIMFSFIFWLLLFFFHVFCICQIYFGCVWTKIYELTRKDLPPPILTTFYRGTIESVLTSCITVWYGNCCAADRKTLQRTVNTAAKIIGAPLPSILDIFLTRCSSKAKSIVEDPTHPSHSLFQLLPSGRRYRSIRARSARLLNSFFPQAVRALNSHHTAPLWNPKQPPPPPPHYLISGKTAKLLFLCNSQVSGPAQATCSNTCSNTHMH